MIKPGGERSDIFSRMGIPCLRENLVVVSSKNLLFQTGSNIMQVELINGVDMQFYNNNHCLSCRLQPQEMEVRVISYELFSRYPFLEKHMPRVELGRWPTPLEPLPELSSHLGGPPLLIKRDDLAHAGYGGNKVRKLELIFADARRKGKKEIITSGGLGSHHILAVAALGSEVGLSTQGLFVCQPVNDHMRANLLMDHAYGTRMHFTKDYVGTALGYIKLYLMGMLRGRAPYILMPGGSSPLSTIGYINCVLELQRQLEEQGLPDPAAIFVPAGTGGTAAGLLAGLALAGMKTDLHAVRVVQPFMLKPAGIVKMARRSLRLLARWGVDIGSATETLAGRLRLEGDYLGEGYGFATPEAEAALELAAGRANLRLEGCYTAKAMAALIDYCRDRGIGEGSAPVLFVNTYSSTHHDTEVASDYHALPPEFWWCFESAPRQCRCGLRKQNRSFCEAVHAGRMDENFGRKLP